MSGDVVEVLRQRAQAALDAHTAAVTPGDAEPVIRVGLALSAFHRALCAASTTHPAVRAVARVLIDPQHVAPDRDES